jgi:hypothetical protein
MRTQFVSACVVAAILGGCAGLEQFPKSSTGYDEALLSLDKEYNDALEEIYAVGVPASKTDTEKKDAAAKKNTSDTKSIPEQKKDIRNQLIEKRLAVIDVHFKNFVQQLAKDNARVDLGVALVGVGVGAAGSLVSETASQILSAVSGGLTGSQAAYSKAVLYEKTIGALLAQMQASRKAIAAEIFESWSETLDIYPMWRARQHLEAYQFAGSIPGAIIATAADAKVKDAEAEKKITLTTEKLTQFAFSPEAQKARKTLNERINGLSALQAKGLVFRALRDFPGMKVFIDAQYPNTVRDSDNDGSKARLVLKRLVLLTGKSSGALEKWDAAVKSQQ